MNINKHINSIKNFLLKRLAIFIFLFLITFFASCSCSEEGGGGSGSSLVSNETNITNITNGAGDGSNSESQHRVALAKDNLGSFILHERLVSYEQYNPIFSKRMIGLVVRPDTTDVLNFTLEDNYVQIDASDVYAVEVDSSVALGNFSCASFGVKLQCEINGIDAISGNLNIMGAKLSGITNSGASVIMGERSTMRSEVTPYILIKSSAGIYNLRTSLGDLPAGYQVSNISESGVKGAFRISADSGVEESVAVFLTHSYHYYDLAMIDTLGTAEISLSFSAMPTSGKLTCSIFDKNIGERSGYACVYNPQIVAADAMVEFTFNSTYLSVDTSLNGVYRINY